MDVDWELIFYGTSLPGNGLDRIAANLQPFENLFSGFWLDEDPNGETIIGVEITVPNECLILMDEGFPGRFWRAYLWANGGAVIEEWQGDENGLRLYMVRNSDISHEELWLFLRQFPGTDLTLHCAARNLALGQ